MSFESLSGSTDPTVTFTRTFSRAASSSAYVSYQVRARNSVGSSSATTVTIKPPGGVVQYQPYTSLAATSDTFGTIALAIGDAWPDESHIEAFLLNASGQVVRQLFLNPNAVRPMFEGVPQGTYTVYARPFRPGTWVAYTSTTVTVSAAESPPPTHTSSPSPTPEATPTAEPTPTGTPTPTLEATASAGATPTAAATPTVEATPTAEATPTTAATPTAQASTSPIESDLFLVPRPTYSKAKDSVTFVCRTDQTTAKVWLILVHDKSPGKERVIRPKIYNNRGGVRSFVARIKGLKRGSYQVRCEVQAKVTIRGPKVSVKIK